MAAQSDTDGSGGLSRGEFAQFWNGLSGPSDIVDGSDELIAAVVNDISMLPQLVADTYSSILCECYNTYGYDAQCCDDTATDDSIASTGTGTGTFSTPGKHDWTEEIWTELSLQGFGGGGEGPIVLDAQDLARKPDWYEKEYRKNFCEWVESAMEEVGVELGEVIAAVVTVAATTTTVAAAATTEAPKTTGAVTTEATTTTATTVAAEEETTTTAFWKPEETNVDEITTTSTTTTTTPPATTTTATTTSTITATTTTSESPIVEWISTTPTDATPTLLEPITLSFLGSTNGKVDANSIDLDEEATHAFMRVALNVLGEMDIANVRRQLKRQLEWDFVEEAAVYFESVVMDVEDVGCPSGLDYAAIEAPCLEFTYTLNPLEGGPLTFDSAQEFTQNFLEATDTDGRLYDALVEEYPETEIVGLGSPGKGIPLGNDGNTNANASANANQSVSLESNGAQTNNSDVQVSGFPVGGYVGIILAAALVALVAMALFVKKSRRTKQQQQELNNSNLSEDLEANEVNEDAANVEDWLDEDDEEDHGNDTTENGGKMGNRMPKSPGSSLAALGVASTVATRLSTGDTEVMIVEKQAWSKKEPVI